MTDQHSRSGIPLRQLYTPADTAGLDYERDLNAPGAFPFTRGQRAGAGRGWIQRELSGEGGPERSNAQLKYLIAQEQMGIDVIGDSPTMAWVDPDHPIARHTVGTQGVSLCSLADYAALYRDLPLDTVSVSASLPPALAVAGLYLVAKQRGIAPAALRGSVLQWPFYAEDCSYAVRMPLSLRLRLALDCIEFATREKKAVVAGMNAFIAGKKEELAYYQWAAKDLIVKQARGRGELDRFYWELVVDFMERRCRVALEWAEESLARIVHESAEMPPATAPRPVRMQSRAGA